MGCSSGRLVETKSNETLEAEHKFRIHIEEATKAKKVSFDNLLLEKQVYFDLLTALSNNHELTELSMSKTVIKGGKNIIKNF